MAGDWLHYLYQNPQEVHIVLIGRSGQGKSYLGNLLLGAESRKDRKFPVADGGVYSCTAECTSAFVTEQGTKYMIYDSPGFPDISDVDDPTERVKPIVRQAYAS